ncbi:hypothetical protein NBRC10512v2_006902 [Rhodotorula toruloides]
MALIGLASASPLLGLPVELLEQIFDDACNDAPPTRPLCRALLPLFDSLSRQRHKRVKIRQPEALLDYGRTVQWRPIVGELCESLTVTQEGGRFLDNVPPVDLRNLLPRLPNLVKLDLTGSALVTNFSEYAASGLEDEKRLPDLRTLALTSSDQVDYSSPFPIEGLYPFHRLERLSITISYLSRGANDYPAPSFPSLRYLSFKFRIYTTTSGISATSTAAARSRRSTRKRHRLDPRSKPRPDSAAGRWKVPQERWKVAGGISHFTRLTKLSLAHGCTARRAPTYNLLRRHPLESLSFGPKTKPSGSHLLKLITGPTKFPTLRSLNLDNLGPGFCRDIDEEEAPEAELEEWLKTGYELVYFPSSFSITHWVNLCDAARVESVESTGSIREAFFVDCSVFDTLRVVERRVKELKKAERDE